MPNLDPREARLKARAEAKRKPRETRPRDVVMVERELQAEFKHNLRNHGGKAAVAGVEAYNALVKKAEIAYNDTGCKEVAASLGTPACLVMSWLQKRMHLFSSDDGLVWVKPEQVRCLESLGWVDLAFRPLKYTSKSHFLDQF